MRHKILWENVAILVLTSMLTTFSLILAGVTNDIVICCASGLVGATFALSDFPVVAEEDKEQKKK